MKKLAELWRKLWQRNAGEKTDGSREKQVIAKCIGCGQCADGCPLVIKVKKR